MDAEDVKTCAVILFFVCLFSVLQALFPSKAFAREQAEKDSVVDLVGVPVGQVLRLWFQEVEKSDYVLCPDLVIDERLVSVRVSKASGLDSWLPGVGLSRIKKSGVSVVCKDGATSANSAVQEKPVESYAVYTPRFRDAGELTKILQKVVPGQYSGGQGANGELSAGQSGGAIDPVLIWRGEEKLKSQFEELVKALDTPSRQVRLRVVVFDVLKGDSDESALGVIARLGGLTFTAGTLPGAGLALSFDNLQAAILNTQNSSNSKLVASPVLMLRDGSTGKIQVGDSVPVLGGIVTTGQASQQSVSYLDTGVVLQITPRVREDRISLSIDQSLSTATQTVTGVSGSPTISKRQAVTQLDIKAGEVVMFSGATSFQQSNSKSFSFGFLPTGTNSSERASELVIAVHAEVVDL